MSTHDLKDMNAVSSNKQYVIKKVKEIWDTFQRYFFYILLAMFVGIWIGVSGAKTFYNDKMDESIQLQGMVYQGKLYNITPK